MESKNYKESKRGWSGTKENRLGEWEEDVLEDELISDGDTPDMVRPIGLDGRRDEVALAGVSRRVRRGGVIPEPDGHVDFCLLDRLELWTGE